MIISLLVYFTWKCRAEEASDVHCPEDRDADIQLGLWMVPISWFPRRPCASQASESNLATSLVFIRWFHAGPPLGGQVTVEFAMWLHLPTRADVFRRGTFPIYNGRVYIDLPNDLLLSSSISLSHRLHWEHKSLEQSNTPRLTIESNTGGDVSEPLQARPRGASWDLRHCCTEFNLCSCSTPR